MIQLGPILNYALGVNAAPLRLDTYMFSSRPDYPETSSLLIPPGLGRHLPRLSRRDDLFYSLDFLCGAGGETVTQQQALFSVWSSSAALGENPRPIFVF